MQALQDEDPAVQSKAARALRRIGPEAEEAIPDLAKAIKDPDSRVQREAINALGGIGPEYSPAAHHDSRSSQAGTTETVIIRKSVHLGFIRLKDARD